MEAPPPAYPTTATAPPLLEADFPKPVTKLHLRFACSNLPTLDLLSKSDPQVVVYLKHSTAPPSWSYTSAVAQYGSNGHPSADFYSKGQWSEIGRTEWIRDDNNPKFVQPVPLDYYFEEEQKVRFEIYDIDKPNRSLYLQDYIGHVETTVAAIVSSRGSTLIVPIQHPKRTQSGKIKIVAEEIPDAGQGRVVRFQLCARNIEKTSIFSKPSTHYVVSRSIDSTFHPIYKSPVVVKSVSPVWPPCEIPLMTMCKGNVDQAVKIQVWDKNNLIGEVVQSFAQYEPARVCGLLKENVKGKTAGKKVGDLEVMKLEIVKIPTFLEYIRGGTEIVLAVAIDWTASNGDPRKPESLHYNCPPRHNDYQQAILAIGTILEEYDADKMFPVYGFGGMLPNRTVSHCFALNGDAENPQVHRVPGILSAYATALSNVTLYGPTNFSPIINELASQIRKEQAQMASKDDVSYHILLMLTDGVITDMYETTAAVVACSNLPISIIIVGLGNADFTLMKALDGDDELLKADGRTAERDIVQFVPFRDFKGGDPQKLAKAVLAEVPEQLVSYMTRKNIKPKRVRANSISSLSNDTEKRTISEKD